MPVPPVREPPQELVTQNAEAIAAVRARAEEDVTRHQRLIERVTGALGRPLALYVVLALVGAWITMNLLMARRGMVPIDAPPFFWLQGCVTLCALLTALMVLTTQNRQSRHGEERAHLDLQVNLAAEQKTAKLIALLEELRRDMPNVRDRSDPMAEAMTHAVDPKAALSALERTFDAPEDDDPGASSPSRGS